MQITVSNRARNAALGTIMLTLFLETLNSSLVTVVMPDIKSSLHAPAQSVRWLISGHALGFGVTLLLAGRLADVLGHRLIYLVGTAIFTAASLWCAMGQDIDQLIAARLFQGVGSAMVVPQVMAFMQILFSATQRVQKVPWLGASAGLGATVGPVLAGVLAQGAGWRTVFWADILFGLLALGCGYAFLPRRTAQAGHRMNMPGTLLLSAAIACLMMALSSLGQWDSLGTQLGYLVAAGALIAASRSRLISPDTPILPPALRRLTNLHLGMGMVVGLAASHASFLVIFNYALQHDRGSSPLYSGLMHLPYSAGVLAGMILLGRRFLIHHGRWVLAGGAVLLGVGATCVMLAVGMAHLPLQWAIPAIVLTGMGVGMSSGCIAPVCLAWVPVGDAGMASALLRLGQQAGFMLGSAVIVQPYFAESTPLDYSKDVLAIVPLQAILVGVVVLALRLTQPLFPGQAAEAVSPRTPSPQNL